MTIQDLINLLEILDPTGEVVVHLVKTDGTEESFEIVDVSENNGIAQINIAEEYL
jgi:hypothetical protein